MPSRWARIAEEERKKREKRYLYVCRRCHGSFSLTFLDDWVQCANCLERKALAFCALAEEDKDAVRA